MGRGKSGDVEGCDDNHEENGNDVEYNNYGDDSIGMLMATGEGITKIKKQDIEKTVSVISDGIGFVIPCDH